MFTTHTCIKNWLGLLNLRFYFNSSMFLQSGTLQQRVQHGSVTDGLPLKTEIHFHLLIFFLKRKSWLFLVLASFHLAKRWGSCFSLCQYRWFCSRFWALRYCRCCCLRQASARKSGRQWGRFHAIPVFLLLAGTTRIQWTHCCNASIQWQCEDTRDKDRKKLCKVCSNGNCATQIRVSVA